MLYPRSSNQTFRFDIYNSVVRVGTSSENKKQIFPTLSKPLDTACLLVL